VVRGWPLPFGAVDNRRSFLASANLADLLVRCLEHPGAANTVFLASDGVDLSTADLVRRIARAADRPARLLPVPAGVVERALRWAGQAGAADKLLGSLPIDSSRARERLAWQPPVSVQDGLSEMTAEVARAEGRR
jgi:nucleoside-diphosphate-sugar epimerase